MERLFRSLKSEWVPPTGYLTAQEVQRYHLRWPKKTQPTVRDGLTTTKGSQAEMAVSYHRNPRIRLTGSSPSRSDPRSIIQSSADECLVAASLLGDTDVHSLTRHLQPGIRCL